MAWSVFAYLDDRPEAAAEEADHRARWAQWLTASNLLTASIDTTVIALWLGHQSIATTQVYLHADMKMKEEALNRTTPTGAEPGRYQPADGTLLAFLQSL